MKQILPIIMLFILSVQASELKLRDRIVTGEQLKASELFSKDSRLDSDGMVRLSLSEGYNYVLKSDLIASLRPYISELHPDMIEGEGILIFKQSKKVLGKGEIVLPRFHKKPEAEENTEERSPAGRYAILPARFRDTPSIPAGTAIVLRYSLSGSIINVHGRLQRAYKPGDIIKIKLLNSDKLIEEKIPENNIIFM